MKRDFFDYIPTLFERESNSILLMAGLGYPRYEELHKKYPNRVLNTEASEQSTLDIAVGLAYAGKLPIVYSITPFLLYRGFETIRTYINHEKLPVVLVGAGREDEYSIHDGFSHFAGDDKYFMQNFLNITSFWPYDTKSLQATLEKVISLKMPAYINIKR